MTKAVLRTGLSIKQTRNCHSSSVKDTFTGRLEILRRPSKGLQKAFKEAIDSLQRGYERPSKEL